MRLKSTNGGYSIGDSGVSEGQQEGKRWYRGSQMNERYIVGCVRNLLGSLQWRNKCQEVINKQNDVYFNFEKYKPVYRRYGERLK